MVSKEEIKDKKIWEDFLKKSSDKSFLDSWNWGEFRAESGLKVWRFGIFDNDILIAIALVSKIVAKRGSFFLIQHGPVLNDLSLKDKVLKTLVSELKTLAKQEGVSFLRINPLWEENEENIKLLKTLGFRKSPMHASAYEATWKIDITSSEEELLKNMRKTTRYLIRKTEKDPDIVIEKSNKPEDLSVYESLNLKVAKRQKFVPFSADYIKREFETFSDDNSSLWLFGKYKGEVVAGALIVFWSGVGFYHQAASLSKHSKLSIPYLLQWEAIKEAKARGCLLYDFWGYTDPQKYPKHPWAGPTLFKMGFGGFKREYVKTQDFIFSKKYWLTYIFETLRKIKRGL